MRTKTYKMRSRAAENGKETHIDLPLEFEGKRAFAIWDSIAFGNFHFKARVEIDPSLRRRSPPIALLHALGVLPRPENN
jgi:hypothetical protein